MASIMNPDQAEAGPSTPRTPPATPPATKSRRRSWFGLVASPFGTGTSSTSGSPRRVSFAAGEGREEGLELADRSQENGAEPRTPTSARRPSSRETDGEEVLTIDGQPETPTSIRKQRQKGRSRGVDEEHGEVVRLDDLSIGRRGSLGKALWPPDAGDGVTAHHDHIPQSDTPMTSPSQLPPSGDSPSRPAASESARPAFGPRTSSLTIPTIRVPPDKSTPVLPIDRPLPALPVPTDIVITPSSPRKLLKPSSHPHTQSRRASASMTDLRAGRTGKGDTNRPHTSGSGSSSRSSSKVISRKSSMIGLGLPKGMGRGDEMAPPPVPQKAQSVSSPHPSRSASPVPKISFAEPEEDMQRGRAEEAGEGTKKDKDKGKRARSLSGIFTRSTSQPVPPKPGSVHPSEAGDGQDEIEVLADSEDDQVETGKMAGVLEWLGVRKPGKRRLSDAKLAKGKAAVEVQDTPGGDMDEGTLRADSRPHMRDLSSTSTIMGPTSNNRSTTPMAIAIPTHRSGFASSSTLDLPNNGDSSAPSPNEADATPYMASPTSEGGEFFIPPTAPWVDATEAAPKTTGVIKDGRLRSRSDASAPSPHVVPGQLQGPTAHGSPDPAPSQDAVRPKLGGRSYSGNSVIIEKMKGVFSKSSARNRSRSKSLLQPEGGAESVDEFGGLATSRGRAGTASTASLASSQQWSPSPATKSSLLDLHNGGRQGALTDTPHELPRASLSGTMYSTPPSSYAQSTTTSTISESAGSIPSTAKPARTRGRASTVSFASSAPQTSFLPPPPPISPSLFPVSGIATPPRRRPSAIQRFSSGLLGTSAPSSPKGSLFPLPPRSSGSTFSGGNDDSLSNGTGATSLLMSPGASPRPSTGSASAKPWKTDIKVEEGESAAGWLDRMVASVGRDEIAGVLASSGDELHTRALELYMAQFDFTHNALDVALRRLLMQISLPKETQQIDRVLEAFAKRYEACEPGLFGSKDNTYVLAFSMMMLHTDAFNRNNKNKMSKADYVRNTRMDGVSPLTLEAFYDNITYAPFVYVDVDAEMLPPSSIAMGGRSRSGSDAISPSPPSTFGTSAPHTPSSGPVNGSTTPSSGSTMMTPRRAPTPTSVLSTSAKQPDVYALITSNNLHPLRVDLERTIPAGSPFSSLGTRPFLETSRIHDTFVSAAILRIADGAGANGTASKRKASGVTGKKGAGSDAEGSVGVDGEISLRVTKVGTLSRRDDAFDSNRKTSRKWKSWSVILSGSQLLFFKDPFWALTLQEQLKAEGADAKRDERGQVLLPRVARFVPEEVFPVKDAVAVWDRSLTGNPHTFRLNLPHRSYLIQAADEYEMNEWIGLINYAAAFKTPGIRMRSGGMKRDQALLAGAAAASSIQREARSLDAAGVETQKGRKRFGSVGDDESPSTPIPIISPRVRTGRSSPRGGARTPLSILTVRSSGDSQRNRAQTPDRSDTSSPVSGRNARRSIESENSGLVVKDDGERLGEVFKAVKAELAASPALGLTTSGSAPPRARAGMKVRIPSSQAVRSTSIVTSIRSFQSKLDTAQSTLDSHLTQARNLAILTPFQRTTRDRISSAIPPLAAKIREERLVIAKLGLWISILQGDLDKEEREWEGVRAVALQGAARSLRGEEGVRGVVLDVAQAEVARVRFEGEDLSSEVREEESEKAEGLEVLQDPSDPDADPDATERRSSRESDRRTYTNGHHDSSGATSLGTTPQELPILIRLSSDEADQQLANVSTDRPGMSRHVSAGG